MRGKWGRGEEGREGTGEGEEGVVVTEILERLCRAGDLRGHLQRACEECLARAAAATRREAEEEGDKKEAEKRNKKINKGE